MSINLNIEINFVKIFRLFRVSFMNFALILINTFVNYNTKVNSNEIFHLFCVNDSLFDDNVDLFCNINNNF